MKKLLIFPALIAVLLLTNSVAHAQGTFGGCGDSPENPTLVLAGLASGAFAVSQVRMKLKARRKK